MSTGTLLAPGALSGAAPAADAAMAASPPAATVLCVDDEPNILSALRRALRPEGWRVLTAGDGQAALELLGREPVDVLISDMRMPGMDGAALLEKVFDGWPDVARILLTGHADMSAAIAAINRGRILRYLGKPWDDAELRATVRQGLEIRELQRERARLLALTRAQNEQLAQANAGLELRVRERTAELNEAHEQLKRRYLTSIKVFSGLIDLRSESLGGHGRRVAETARRLAQAAGMGADEAQQVFVAGLLHDMALTGLPDAMLQRPVSHYGAEELAQYQRHPVVAEQLLMPMDDMAPVAALVRAHHERPDGQGFPDRRQGSDIPPGARILAIADAFEDMRSGHLGGARLSLPEARTMIRHGRGTLFDAEMVDVFLQMTEPERPQVSTDVTLNTLDMQPGMVLSRDLVSGGGLLMLTAGHVLSAALIERIRTFEQREGKRITAFVKPRA